MNTNIDVKTTDHRDVYDRAVEFFQKCSLDIFNDQWGNCMNEENKYAIGRILFGPVDRNTENIWDTDCRCLSQIRSNRHLPIVQLNELLGDIASDERIPTVSEFRPDERESLPIYAEWRRKIDKVLGTKPPEWPNYIPTAKDID